ncbi:MAG: hypothetical protein LBJ03_00990 [Holosporales bacterium]|jgi:hypothetical protein|nr:hypothetical protein [Holosporales bacterium]
MIEIAKALSEKQDEFDSILRAWHSNSDMKIFNVWKNEVSGLLSSAIARKFDIIQNQLTSEAPFNVHIAKAVKVIIADEMYKLSCQEMSKTKLDVEKLKLLKARDENLDFELRLAEMICGGNESFPYRSSSYITSFFADLGLPWKHEGSTRRYWISERLKESNIHNIHKIISEGLFKRSYWQNRTELENAKSVFKKIIEDSIEMNQGVNLSDLLNLNISDELLFDKKIDTNDETLNDLIEKAKKLFTQGDKQMAVEKLWDAFERIKTLNGLDKKVSTKELLKNFGVFNVKLNDEFKELTDIGNNYQIRHYETDKEPIHLDKVKKYLFFRMLILIELVL